MRSVLTVPTGLLALALAASSCAPQANRTQMGTTHLAVGDAAPDFRLLSNERRPVSLADYRGKKNVILAFYVFAFTGG